MSSLSIVVADPFLKGLGSAVRVQIGQGVGRLPEPGMDDPLGLSNSFQHASPGSAVLDAECLATLGEELQDVTRAAVQHHPLDGDADAE